MPEALLLRADATGTARDQSRRGETTEEEMPGRALLCRRCRTKVSHESELFAFGADSAVRIFANAAGLLREVFTARRAQRLTFVGPPTTEFTWFAGYGWEAAFCAECESHLGWRFSRPTGTPAEFFGLLTAEVVADESAG